MVTRSTPNRERRPACVALDVGGTKIASALVDASGSISHRSTRPTPREGGPSVLAALVATIRQLVPAAPVDAVGIGFPGVVDASDGSIVSATDTLPGVSGLEVQSRLEAVLGLPVAVDNDVNVMARGEMARGAARSFSDALFISVGTGLGGAIARDGEVLSGVHGTAGEIAHLLAPRRGSRACGCGRLDHVESLVCGPAIEDSYRRSTGESLDVAAIAARALSGDLPARRCIGAAAGMLGRVMSGLVTALDVQAVVVGGGVAQAGPVFVGPFTEALRAEVLPPLVGIAIVPAALGTDAPLVGAAALARKRRGHTGVWR